MSNVRITKTDCFGLAKSAMDAHTLGLVSIEQLLRECGYQCVTADSVTCAAFDRPDDRGCIEHIVKWLRHNHITVFGFSYRLDPQDGANLFGRLMHELKLRRLLGTQKSILKAIYFAGLPRTCDLVRKQIREVAGTFSGDETPAEVLSILGVETQILPRALVEGIAYDEARLAFGKDLIQSSKYLSVRPIDRTGYSGFGTSADKVLMRVQHGTEQRLPPLMRAHAGPYLSNRPEAIRLFLDWTRQLAASRFLDILSIGTSQLTQSSFEEDWDDKPNGGGVPLNSRKEFAAVWSAARPMLVRTYAGTKNIRSLAQMYEETIHIAWHALSLWWFCRIDGRGPYTVRQNLQQHIETLKYIAGTGKPFEPNVPHHFAFRGADDVTYVVSAVLAARVAKAHGIRYLVLQNMLNTPKYTWGVQDLAKARAMLQLVRELEDNRFRIILQPRGGLDYFAVDPEKAKTQLAAVTALMDDIEPGNSASPQIIHVVSYSEGTELATPAIINESIQITRYALEQYRKLRSKGYIADMSRHPEVLARTEELLSEARTVLHAIESVIPNPYSPEGLYQILAGGFLPIPYLWECRDELTHAVRWQTRLIHGSVKVVDEHGMPISAKQRMSQIVAQLRFISSSRLLRKARRFVCQV